MDEKQFELAAALELSGREEAIATARSHDQQSHVRPVEFDGSCPACGEQINPLRIAALYFTCVDCAREQEHRNRLGLAGAPK